MDRGIQVDGEVHRFRDEAGLEWEVYETRVGAAAGFEPQPITMLHFHCRLSGRTVRANSADPLTDLTRSQLIEVLERAEFDDFHGGGL